MSEKILCLLAYILSVPGALIARFAGKNNNLILHHARRSLELFFFMVFLFILWVLIMFVMMIIPYAFIIGAALFGVVICAGIFCIILSVRGIVYAFKGKTINFPLVSSLAKKIEPVFKLLQMPV